VSSVEGYQGIDTLFCFGIGIERVSRKVFSLKEFYNLQKVYSYL
jgi:hypothetical protein